MATGFTHKVGITFSTDAGTIVTTTNTYLVDAESNIDEVLAEMRARRDNTTAKDAPDEIVEVVVVRSATIRTEIVSIEED